jgi:hypothetical protein
MLREVSDVVIVTEYRNKQFEFHDLTVSIIGSGGVLASLESRFAQFPIVEVVANDCTADLTFSFFKAKAIADHQVKRPESPGRSFYVPAVGEAVYFPDEDALYLDYGGRVRALCKPAEGHCAISLLSPEIDQVWLATHPLFTIPFIEMLKRRGKLSVHAAGFAADGRSVLLPGTTGAGKSTLTIALLRGGLHLLGDDMTFIEYTGTLESLAFPENIDVTDATLSFFDELHTLADRSKRTGAPKHELRPSDYFESHIVWRSQPAAIVFPQVSKDYESRIVPIDSDTAFLELAPNVLLTESSSTRMHFDILAQLVRSTPCYRLFTGRDFDRLPMLVRELLTRSTKPQPLRMLQGRKSTQAPF